MFVFQEWKFSARQLCGVIQWHYLYWNCICGPNSFGFGLNLSDQLSKGMITVLCLHAIFFYFRDDGWTCETYRAPVSHGDSYCCPVVQLSYHLL